MKYPPQIAALLLAANLHAQPAASPRQPSENLPVSEDRRLLESTRPTAAIVPEVTPLVPSEGSLFQQWWNGEAATGDWFGLRDTLDGAGVTLFGSYEANMAGNVTGGRSRGFAYADNFDFGVRLELEKLIGWKGATFTVDASDRNGRSVTDRYIGNFYQVQQLFGVGTLMLYGVYLNQKFLDDRVSLKLGRFATAADFATSPIYGLYMGNGIDGNPKTLVASGAFSSYPGSVWAARLRVEPTKETNVSLGVYQTNDRLYDRHLHGVNWSIEDGDGVLLIGQIGWSPEFFKKPVQTPDASTEKAADGKQVHSFKEAVEMKGLPGHYWFGSYVSLWQVPQFGTTEKGNGPYAFYWHADQMVFQEAPGSGQGLTLWSDFVLQPDQSVNIIPFQVSGGAAYKGLIPTRDEDVTIFGVVYGQFSRDYARTVAAQDLGTPESEIVFEGGYRIQLTKFAYVMPDVQWIVNPGGTGNIGDALVLGLRTGVTF